MIKLRDIIQGKNRVKRFARTATFLALSVAVGITGYAAITHQTNASTTPWVPSHMTSIQSVSSDRTCGIDAGVAYCWGNAIIGNDLNYQQNASTTPVAVDRAGVLSGKTVTNIAMSTDNTCVLTSDGGVYCWGLNQRGENGNGANSQNLTPVSIDRSGALAGKTITQLQATPSGTFYVIANGQLYGWGLNVGGNIGDGSLTDQNAPVAIDTSGVLGGKTIAKLVSTDENSCALTTDNILACWGNNTLGQAGNGTVSTYESSPLAVNQTGVLAGKTISDISIGAGANICVVANGAAYCWGYNSDGELGAGYQSNNSLVPVAVDATGVLLGKTVTKVMTESRNSCALTADGGVYCWGMNIYGENGNGSTTSNSSPVQVYTSGVLAGKTVTNIYKGYYGFYALAGGQLFSWGSNIRGTLGAGITANTPSAVPVAVDKTGVLSGKSIDAFTPIENALSYCALASGQPVCWGYNANGQLGNGITDDTVSPVAVQLLVPEIDSLSSNTEMLDGSTHTITLYGQDFTQGSTVTFDGVEGVIRDVTQTAISVSIPTLNINQSTTVDVTVTSPAGASATLPQSFTFTLPAPSSLYLSVSEMSAFPGAASQTVVVNGSHFVSGSQVTIDGVSMQTTYVSHGELHVLIPSPGISSDRTVDVTVTNPDGQSVTLSNGFSYRSRIPTLLGADRATTFNVDGTDKTLGLYGTNFDGAVVTTNLPGSTYDMQNGILFLTLPTSGLTQTFNVNVTLTNSYGLTATFNNVVTLFVQGTPSVSSVNFTTVAGQKALIISGQNFPLYTDALARSLVSLNGMSLPFCTTNVGANAATFIQAYGLSPSLVSDAPTCYLLINAQSAAAFTSTQVVVLLMNNFDITAPGTVSVYGGTAAYMFNQSVGGGEEDTPDQPVNGDKTTDTPNADSQSSGSAQKPISKSTETTPVDTVSTPETSTSTPTILSSGSTVTDNSVIEAKPTFSGIAAPYSTVTVTVHSDPVTCTTKADELGRWSCTLDSSLPEGDHTVQVSVVTTDGLTTVLGPYKVTVSAGKAAEVSGQVTSPANKANSMWIVIASIAGVLGIVALIISLIVRARKSRRSSSL